MLSTVCWDVSEEDAGSACRFELGRQPANTKLSSNVTVRRVRVRGGNFKFRALRLDVGNFAWGTEVSRSISCLESGTSSLTALLYGFA